MGYNLPPGVTASMIPGNRSEDLLWEEIACQVWKGGPSRKRGVAYELVGESVFKTIIHVMGAKNEINETVGQYLLGLLQNDSGSVQERK
jgi:hypothetical protein